MTMTRPRCEQCGRPSTATVFDQSRDGRIRQAHHLCARCGRDRKPACLEQYSLAAVGGQVSTARAWA